MLENIDGCKANPENSSTAKASKHIPSGFSMSSVSSFRSKEKNHDVYKGKDYMKRFCRFLRKHEIKIILKRKQEVINKRAAEII